MNKTEEFAFMLGKYATHNIKFSEYMDYITEFITEKDREELTMISLAIGESLTKSKIRKPEILKMDFDIQYHCPYCKNRIYKQYAKRVCNYCGQHIDWRIGGKNND